MNKKSTWSIWQKKIFYKKYIFFKKEKIKFSKVFHKNVCLGNNNFKTSAKHLTKKYFTKTFLFYIRRKLIIMKFFIRAIVYDIIYTFHGFSYLRTYFKKYKLYNINKAFDQNKYFTKSFLFYIRRKLNFMKFFIRAIV